MTEATNARARFQRDLDGITHRMQRLGIGHGTDTMRVRQLRGFALGAWQSVLENLPQVEQELITLEQRANVPPSSQ